MRSLILGVIFAAWRLAAADDPLTKAYEALTAKDYDHAVSAFLAAVAASPARADIRKDLAYTYLKVGESEAAREQFGEAMRLDPEDRHLALEYAFLCYESRDDAVVWKATARRIFDRLRKEGNAEAALAFANVDRPLEQGIERWTRALELGPGSFSAHYELAQLAEQRDQLDMAAQHYLLAWKISPSVKGTLIDLGRVLSQLGKIEDARAAWLAASRGTETRAAERARELLPQRYPYAYEFRKALDLDPSNVELHREFGYLLLKLAEGAVGDAQSRRLAEAEEEFRVIVASAPQDLLSRAQLGFLYLGRKDMEHAMPLLKSVMEGNDKELANRVRTALHFHPEMEKRTEPAAETFIDVRLLGEKSYAAGYMKDALKYLTVAHAIDPADYAVMLKLGYTENMLHDDTSALVWFNLARQSPDLSIAAQAKRAFANLRPNLSKIRTTVWLSPFYSTRWNDNFAYGQIKTELRVKGIFVHPYASVRFIGDTQGMALGAMPLNLSESSFIFAGGAATNSWHGATFWGEAGRAVSYLGDPGQKDLRGGVAWSRLWGPTVLSDEAGAFVESNADGVFVSRFGNDSLAVLQNKGGFNLPRFGLLHSQVFVNADVTQDTLRQYWANFVDLGPGVRLHLNGTPQSLVFSMSLVRGVYTHNEGNPRSPNFFDVRAGFWYAFTR